MISSSELLYYTDDHEWIDFLGSVAYVGVCGFKLKDLKKISSIECYTAASIVRKGEILAMVISEDNNVPIHMPVDGRVIEINTDVISSPEKVQVRDQQNIWIAKIRPFAPYSREGVQPAKQYQLLKKKAAHKI